MIDDIPGRPTIADGIDETRRRSELLAAQNRAAQLFAAVDAAGIIQAGTLESEATDAITRMATDMFGLERHWHKRIVRSGPNTVLTYPADPPDRRMASDDIAFVDFGPVFHGWEADFGRTWVIGDDPVKHRLRSDLAAVFQEGREFFEAQSDVTGEELYRQVVELAERRDWVFGNHHCGHLVGEYPHEDFPGERSESHLMVGNTGPIRRVGPSGRVAHWILEVHLVAPNGAFGGFHEELLTVRASD